MADEHDDRKAGFLELLPGESAQGPGRDPEPVSIASIGQVYRGRLPDGAEVAVKVRHPAIDEAIRSDFRVASLATALAGAMAPGMGATARDFVGELLARLRLPGRLVFLFRIRFGLFAVRSRLGAVNDWAALERRLFKEAR